MEGEDAERTQLRLESDADAVQIVTIHKSKGLEYDVVFAPGLWQSRCTPDDAPVLVHENGAVVLDHGSPRRAERGTLAERERLAEDLRLAYVALTRARFRCYVGWGPVLNRKSGDASWQSSLAWLLRDASRPWPLDAAQPGFRDALDGWRATLDALVAQDGDAMSVEVLDDERTGGERWSGTLAARADAVAREWRHPSSRLESWRIASFTSLTAGRHVEDARDTSDPASSDAEAEAALVRARSDFLAFPAGRKAGIVLHELFEKLDFAAAPADVRALATEILLRERMADDERDGRIDGVCAMAERVLAGQLPHADFALRDVPLARTLREWKFQLPLGAVSGAVLAERFARHGGDLARRYAPSLRGLSPERTHGFLTGVVDLALEHRGRWWVADWKSNHLGVRPEQYDAGALEAEMFSSHYVLQYHLYVTALHRFLRTRLPGYDYDRAMGGVAYVFLRGVDGTGRGWFHDRPPLALIESLDALMDAGVAA
jgi:exodeoxyribonuclease V beta subunit